MSQETHSLTCELTNGDQVQISKNWPGIDLAAAVQQVMYRLRNDGALFGVDDDTGQLAVMPAGNIARVIIAEIPPAPAQAGPPEQETTQTPDPANPAAPDPAPPAPAVDPGSETPDASTR